MMKKTRKIFEIVYLEDCRPVSAFLRELDEKALKKVYTKLKGMQQRDFPLVPPDVKAFRQERHKGLFELRTRTNKLMSRIIFCFDDKDNVILLHGFIKKQDRDTVQALETARARKLALVSGAAGVTLLPQGGNL